MSNGAAENGVDRQVQVPPLPADHCMSTCHCQAADQDQQGGGGGQGRGDGGGKRGGSSYVPPHLRSLPPPCFLKSFRPQRISHFLNEGF